MTSIFFCSAMLPVVWIIVIIWRQAKDVAFKGYPETIDGAVDVVKVTRNLIDLEDFAVGKTGFAKFNYFASINISVDVALSASHKRNPRVTDRQKRCLDDHWSRLHKIFRTMLTIVQSRKPRVVVIDAIITFI